MNDSFLVSLPSSFPSKLFKSTKYEYDFNHQRTKRTLDLRRNSPLGLQKSKTYNSKLSESLDVFGPNKLLSSLTLRLDKKTQNFSDDSLEISKEDFYEKANTVILSNDDQQISQFISTFKGFLESSDIKSRYILEKILKSEEFIENIITAINNTDCDSFGDGIRAEKVKTELFEAASLIFTYATQEMRVYFIDAGICFNIQNTLSGENGIFLLNDLNILSKVRSGQGQIKIDDSLSTGTDVVEDVSSNENHLISSISLYSSALNLLSNLVEPSTYARDCILTLEIHEMIADIIDGLSQFLEESKNPESPLFESIGELLIMSSYCMESIFKNLNDIERKYVIDILPRFIRFLRIRNLKFSYNIIQTLLYIVRMIPSTVFILFQIEDGEIKEHILQLLIGDYKSFKSDSGKVDQNYLEENEDLIEITLKFLGNLCQSKPSEVISLYQSGLCDILRVLMNSPKLITEVLWVLSNMYEAISDQMIDEITSEFIEEIVNYSKNCNYNCKLETGYFLATVIVYSPQSIAMSFIVEEIIFIIVEVIGCGQIKIVKKAANAIARLVNFAQITNELQPLLSFLEASDLKGRIRELLDDDEKICVYLDNSIGLEEFYRIICDLFESSK